MLYEDILMHDGRRYAHRYLKFIQICNAANIDYDGIMEKHHILPTSLFPEYSSLKLHPWNMVRLTPRQHFIAHWMLAKLYGGKMWYAFNMMRRTGHTSCLYEISRDKLKSMFKEMNRGRPKTSDEILAISRRTKNTVVVRDANGNIFRTSCSDPRYLSGELVYYRTGLKHTDSTISKMKMNSGIKGKQPFMHGNTVLYLTPEEGITRGLVMGICGDIKSKISKTISNTIWVTRKDEGSHTRITIDNFDDTLYIKGRIGYKGWQHVNSKRK